MLTPVHLVDLTAGGVEVDWGRRGKWGKGVGRHTEEVKKDHPGFVISFSVR